MRRRDFLVSAAAFLGSNSEAAEKPETQASVTWQKEYRELADSVKTSENETGAFFAISEQEVGILSKQKGTDLALEEAKGEYELVSKNLDTNRFVLELHSHPNKSFQKAVGRLNQTNSLANFQEAQYANKKDVIAPPSEEGIFELNANGDLVYAIFQAYKLNSEGKPWQNYGHGTVDALGLWLYKIDLNNPFVKQFVELIQVLESSQDQEIKRKIRERFVKKFGDFMEDVKNAYGQLTAFNLSKNVTVSDAMLIRANICNQLSKIGIKMEFLPHKDALKLSPEKFRKFLGKK